MRISDWSSDVCSSDLARRAFRGTGGGGGARPDRPGTLDFGEARRSSDPRESGGAEPFLPCRGAGGGAARRRRGRKIVGRRADRSEEHTSELQSLMRISYAVFCLKKKKKRNPKYVQSKENH